MSKHKAGCQSGDFGPCDCAPSASLVAKFVESYRFEFDGGQQYTPAEHERAMLEDAIEGYLASHHAG